MQDRGYSVQEKGAGHGVQGKGTVCRTWGAGHVVQNSGQRVQDMGFGGVKHGVQKAGHGVQGGGHCRTWGTGEGWRSEDMGCRVYNTEHGVQGKGSEFRTVIQSPSPVSSCMSCTSPPAVCESRVDGEDILCT